MPKPEKQYSELCIRVGERVRAKRIELGMSQEELAERAQVATNTICRIENGTGSSGIITYFNVACALKISLTSLFAEVGDKDSRASDILSIWEQMREDDRQVVYITYRAMTQALRNKKEVKS